VLLDSGAGGKKQRWRVVPAPAVFGISQAQGAGPESTKVKSMLNKQDVQRGSADELAGFLPSQHLLAIISRVRLFYTQHPR
jgi:hypothetical protein